MVSDNPELLEPFPKPPMEALRQGPNLRRILCKSKLHKVSRNPTRATHRSSAGWKRCSASVKRQCNVPSVLTLPTLPLQSHHTSLATHITSKHLSTAKLKTLFMLGNAPNVMKISPSTLTTVDMYQISISESTRKGPIILASQKEDFQKDLLNIEITQSLAELMNLQDNILLYQATQSVISKVLQ